MEEEIIVLEEDIELIYVEPKVEDNTLIYRENANVEGEELRI